MNVETVPIGYICSRAENHNLQQDLQPRYLRKAPSYKQVLKGMTLYAANSESESGSVSHRKETDFAIFDDGCLMSGMGGRHCWFMPCNGISGRCIR